jgi:hypothetical protein
VDVGVIVFSVHGPRFGMTPRGLAGSATTSQATLPVSSSETELQCVRNACGAVQIFSTRGRAETCQKAPNRPLQLESTLGTGAVTGHRRVHGLEIAACSKAGGAAATTSVLIGMQQFSISRRSARIGAVVFGFLALGYVSNAVTATHCQVAAARGIGSEIREPAQGIESPLVVYVTREDEARYPDSQALLLRADLTVRSCREQYVETNCWPRAFVAQSEGIIPWTLSVSWGWQSGPALAGIQQHAKGRGARTRFLAFFGVCVRLWDANGWYMQAA